jgi:hypothetical protein
MAWLSSALCLVSRCCWNRTSPDMIPVSLCIKKRLEIQHMNRPLFSMTLSIPSYGSFGGLVVSMLTSGTQDCGFTPSRSRQIFRAKKSSACLPSEGK